MQTTLAGYYDGTTVVFDEPIDVPKGQRLIITFVDQSPNKEKLNCDELFGALHQYANPSLIKKEKDAWAMAAAEKHRNFLDENIGR